MLIPFSSAFEIDLRDGKIAVGLTLRDRVPEVRGK